MIKNKKTILITLDKLVLESLNKYSKESLIPKSTLINKLIKDHLQQLNYYEK